MFSSTLARRSSAAVTSIVWSNKASSLPAINVAARQCFEDFKQQPQVRTIVTKKRVHRQEKRKRKEDLATKGVSPPKPHMYMPVDTPVINAVSREERDAESRRSDELAAQALKERMEVVKEPLLRFGFSEDNLKMSDRVKKLFDLQNGNQQEVIKAQKKRGMELFQMRDGDTGSSGVQGA
jgi:hypothetical protein